MREIKNQAFSCIDDRPLLPWQQGRVVEEAEYRGCRFQSCTISATVDSRRRSHARRINLVSCSTLAVSIYSLVAEEVVVESLKTEDLLQTWGAVLKHVALRGQGGRIMISSLPVRLGTASQRNALLRANAEYYRSVDWALDIADAEFRDVDLRGVPGHLIRRNPATQALVTRECAREGKWMDVDLSGTPWPISLQRLAESDRDSEVLVAANKARDFEIQLDGLRHLRDAGIAELE